MTEKIELHGHELEFLKNEGKAVIQIDLGDMTDECYLIDIFSVDEIDYVALVSSQSNEIYIFYHEESFDNDQIDLRVVESEEELDEVFELFNHYWDDEAIDNLIEEYNIELDIYDSEEEYIDEDDIIEEDMDEDILEDQEGDYNLDE